MVAAATRMSDGLVRAGWAPERARMLAPDKELGEPSSEPAVLYCVQCTVRTYTNQAIFLYS